MPILISLNGLKTDNQWQTFAKVTRMLRILSPLARIRGLVAPEGFILTLGGRFGTLTPFMSKEKVLIIRFSSFGDVTQCLSVAALIKTRFPGCEVHWVTRDDMSVLLENHASIDKTWSYSRKAGFAGLWELALKLRGENFTHVYDAHNNLRSRVIGWVLGWPKFSGPQPTLLRRSIRRWKRLLLFKFRINLFQMPFSGQRDLIEPLAAWGVPVELPPTPQLYLTSQETSEVPLSAGYIALAPSAAYELKRWPIEYWKNLIERMPGQKFVLLGGPQDHFLSDIQTVAPDRVTNLAGKTGLRASAAVIAKADALVSNDTGLLHVGEQLGKPTIALMGPAPFGFPSRPSTRILELNLPCRPCSKHGQGPCKNPKFHQCLRDIRPESVVRELQQILEV